MQGMTKLQEAKVISCLILQPTLINDNSNVTTKMTYIVLLVKLIMLHCVSFTGLIKDDDDGDGKF